MTTKNLHQLMYGLLYPAVLGTIFVLFVEHDLASGRLSPKVLFGVVFLVHFCLEFILAVQTESVDGYSVPDFLGDLFLIVIIYKAFLSLPSDEGACDYKALYFWVMLVPVVFLSVDVVQWIRRNDPLLRPIMAIDTILFLLTLGFSVAAAYRGDFRASDTAAFWFVAAIAIASVASFIARKRRFDSRPS